MKPYSFFQKDGIYFCTDVIVGFACVFMDHDFFNIIIKSLEHCQKKKGLNIHAFVIMPSHVHTVISAKNGNLPDIVRNYKRHTSNKINYTHYNPVKKGYVTEPEHWQYSSAKNYLLGDDPLLKIDRLWASKAVRQYN